MRRGNKDKTHSSPTMKGNQSLEPSNSGSNYSGFVILDSVSLAVFLRGVGWSGSGSL